MAAPALRPPQRGWSDRSRHGRAPCGARGPQPECEPRHREPGAGAQGGRRQGADHRRRDRRCVAATGGAGLRGVLAGHVYGLGAEARPHRRPTHGMIAHNQTHSPKDISMTAHDQILATEALAAGERTQTLSDWISSIGQRTATWLDSCADYYAATAMYEQLSALSDAELMRRGLSRAALAHDVRTACDRNSRI